METPVVENKRWMLWLRDPAKHFVKYGSRCTRVKAAKSFEQATLQQYLPIIGPLRHLAVWRNLWTIAKLPTAILKPGERQNLEFVFRNHRCASRIEADAIPGNVKDEPQEPLDKFVPSCGIPNRLNVDIQERSLLLVLCNRPI